MRNREKLRDVVIRGTTISGREIEDPAASDG
jgi:hypothetical protein